jgi:hypothetical protein
MLEPDDRLSLLDSLRPPPGFALDQAVGTTFSLDLFALLTAPVAFALLEADATEDGGATPTSVLEAIRRNASRMDVFCQAGQIAVPSEYKPLVAYVEEVVHEVTAPVEGRVFHPKVWVLRFTSSTGDCCFRLLCLSRNLTFDRSWDTVPRIDGVPSRRTRALTSRNRPLSKFVEALPALVGRGMKKPRAEAVRQLADELLAVEFEVPPGMRGLRFWPLGTKGMPSWPFARDEWTHTRLLVVSPFLSPGLLQRLHAPGARDVLVSRGETLDTLKEESLAQFENVMILSSAAGGSDVAVASELGPEDEALAERPEFPLKGLHSKLFVSEYHHSARLWTGSANATNAAFNGNVEFLVELEGPRSLCGIEAVLEGQSGGVKLRDLLEAYESPETPPEESAQQRLERRLDEIRRGIATRGFEAIATSREGTEESFSILVHAALPS